MSNSNEPDGDTGVITRTKPKSQMKTKKPPMYRVLIHNDDYTSQPFVVMVLQRVFHKTPDEAFRIMKHVHHNGIGVAGVFTREVAETKIAITERLAEQHEFPLRLTMEPEDDSDE